MKKEFERTGWDMCFTDIIREHYKDDIPSANDEEIHLGFDAKMIDGEMEQSILCTSNCSKIMALSAIGEIAQQFELGADLIFHLSLIMREPE